jgi:hypothetical protein
MFFRIIFHAQAQEESSDYQEIERAGSDSLMALPSNQKGGEYASGRKEIPEHL